MDKRKQIIVLVEDDPFLLEMYARKFKEEGFDIITFKESKEALRRFEDKSFSPDVVLLDLTMPVMNGFELLQTIKKENLVHNACVIILSNLNAPEDKEKAQALGADGYIVKASVTPSEVVKKVVNFLEEKKSHTHDNE